MNRDKKEYSLNIHKPDAEESSLWARSKNLDGILEKAINEEGERESYSAISENFFATRPCELQAKERRNNLVSIENSVENS